MSAALAMPLTSAEENTAGRPACVLTLTPFFPSAQDPAQGCFISEPIGRLRQSEIETRVIAVSPFYRQPQDACVAGSEWKKYYCAPGNVGLVTSGSLLAKAIRPRVLELHRTSPIRLIHAHAALPCGEAAMMLANELNVPFVVSVHGLDAFAERQAGPWLGPWTRRRSLRVYENAKRIVCISGKVCELLPRELRVKARVIYNGVDSETFSPAPGGGSRLRILSVGNLIPTKGHAVLLRAIAAASEEIPAIELEIIGDGPERSRLATLAAALGISASTMFRGRQDRRGVARAMQDCAAFALPSQYEGLGCVYLEAMACAKPAIACFGQGIEEIIRDGENGRLIHSDDQTALTAALVELLRDAELRRRMGMAARETILKQHTLEHQAGELAELYRECAP